MINKKYYLKQFIILEYIKKEDFKSLPKSFQENINLLPNVEISNGMVISYNKSNKKLISLVLFYNSIFPNYNAMTGHIKILQKGKEYIGFLLILASIILILKINKKDNVLLNFSIEGLKTMLMFLDLGFKIASFSKFDNKHVLISKTFDEKLLNEFNFELLDKINILRIFNFKFNSENIKNNFDLNLHSHHKKIFCKWIGFDLKFKSIKKLNTLFNLQKQFEIVHFSNNNSYFYLIVNNKSQIGFIISNYKSIKRNKLFVIHEKLNYLRINKIYTFENYQNLDALLLLNNFIQTNYGQPNMNAKLYCWENYSF